jgi:hypothetical protein
MWLLPGGYVGPPYKRLKGAPSDCADPLRVKNYVPTLGDSSGQHAKACFMAGREVEVDFSTALPAMLLAPEFGLLHDAAYLYGQWTPPDMMFKVGSERC